MARKEPLPSTPTTPSFWAVSKVAMLNFWVVLGGGGGGFGGFCRFLGVLKVLEGFKCWGFGGFYVLSGFESF